MTGDQVIGEQNTGSRWWEEETYCTLELIDHQGALDALIGLLYQVYALTSDQFSVCIF